ncbi:MAG TPA: SDR family NAD(P)-dependent oxidoreductase [Myxococcales bacterium]|jgi:3-hydroxy acid dehydrogenase/malonic semialdehyde reductase|nr:SDR family NAD(P)-dependent oxidoreductase [Myxococcales bacterium]
MSDKGLVVITGASSGFGAATALGFARLGHPLYIGARRMDRLREVAQQCLKAGAPRAEARPLDVRSKESIEAFCAGAGTPEVLLNNAGGALGRDPVTSLRDEDLLGMMEANVIGLLRVTRALLPRMIAARRGHVVNLGSYAAHGVYEGGAAYAATKHSVRVISQTLRLELSGTGIRVTEIDPGLAETEFSVVRLGDPEKAKAVYQGFKPLTAEDVADAILWVATRPPHVNIAEVVMTPTAQASLTKVHRE